MDLRGRPGAPFLGLLRSITVSLFLLPLLGALVMLLGVPAVPLPHRLLWLAFQQLPHWLVLGLQLQLYGSVAFVWLT